MLRYTGGGGLLRCTGGGGLPRRTGGGGLAACAPHDEVPADNTTTTNISLATKTSGHLTELVAMVIRCCKQTMDRNGSSKAATDRTL